MGILKKALQGSKKEPRVSSGVPTWAKALAAAYLARTGYANYQDVFDGEQPDVVDAMMGDPNVDPMALNAAMRSSGGQQGFGPVGGQPAPQGFQGVPPEQLPQSGIDPMILQQMMQRALAGR